MQITLISHPSFCTFPMAVPNSLGLLLYEIHSLIAEIFSLWKWNKVLDQLFEQMSLQPKHILSGLSLIYTSFLLYLDSNFFSFYPSFVKFLFYRSWSTKTIICLDFSIESIFLKTDWNFLFPGCIKQWKSVLFNSTSSRHSDLQFGSGCGSKTNFSIVINLSKTNLFDHFHCPFTTHSLFTGSSC